MSDENGFCEGFSVNPEQCFADILSEIRGGQIRRLIIEHKAVIFLFEYTLNPIGLSLCFKYELSAIDTALPWCIPHPLILGFVTLPVIRKAVKHHANKGSQRALAGSILPEVSIEPILELEVKSR